MSWDHDEDDLEQAIQIYSELEVNPEVANGFTVPKTIQRYQQKIQSNNNASIFDTNYYLESLANNGDENVKVDNEVHNDFLDDENTIKVAMGRGRGGRNTFYRPGDLTTTKNGEDLMHEIRKVNPVGYSNAITEQSVKAHHKKSSVNNSVNTTPKKEMEIVNTPIASPLTASSMSLASDVDEASTREDSSSEYWTAQGVEVIEAEEPSNIDDGKPLPITKMLQKNRECGKQRQMQRQLQALEAYNRRDQELASRRCIEDLLRQDLEETQIKQAGISSSSSNASFSSRDEGTPLSWRQRTNSPPRYQWNQQQRRNETTFMNINSPADFPPLK